MSRVQSIERAFAVLAALADGPIGVTGVAERVGLPKSTVARLLGSLQREGAVEQVEAHRLAGLRREDRERQRQERGDEDELAVASKEGAHGYR